MAALGAKVKVCVQLISYCGGKEGFCLVCMLLQAVDCFLAPNTLSTFLVSECTSVVIGCEKRRSWLDDCVLVHFVVKG